MKKRRIYMRTIVVYSSRTGNTKKVGEAIAAALPEGTRAVSVQQVPADLADYDCVFLGFWVDRGQADKDAANLLPKLRNKHVALFATRRRHDGIFERMIVFCRCHRRSRRLFLCCLTRLLRHLRRPSGGGCRHKCSRDDECEHLLFLALQNISFFHKFSSSGSGTSSSRRRVHRRRRG